MKDKEGEGLEGREIIEGEEEVKVEKETSEDEMNVWTWQTPWNLKTQTDPVTVI